MQVLKFCKHSKLMKKKEKNNHQKNPRALQIFYTHGITKTDLINSKNDIDEKGVSHAPLRYKNACVFAMTCETESNFKQIKDLLPKLKKLNEKLIFKALNKRLDSRVDDMLANGLLEEIKNFKTEFESQFKG